jgi:cyclic pyranopterin phosphate synthase
MPDEDVNCTPHAALMNPDEILELAATFVSLGVNKIRLTGGEPLVRKEFLSILEKLAQLPVELTLTTNGILLDKYIENLKQAGVRSLNISLDTLNAEKFTLLTRRDLLNKVLQNIDLCLQNGLHTKINMVVMKGINEAEISDFVRLSFEQPLHIRFIEFMPFSGNRWMPEKVYPMSQILADIEANYHYISLGKEPHATARKFFVEGSKGSFSVISTMSHPFCGDCNRLRLTADGKMKNCLFASTETDLLGALRQGQQVQPLIEANLKAKKEMLGGQFNADFEKIDPERLQNRSMIAIGG